jgi:hypothetical protein
MPEGTKPMTIRPNERMISMIEAIKAEKGLKSTSDVFFYSIGEVYHKLFPVYAAKRGIGGETQDPEEIARHKVAVAEASQREKERVANAERSKICTTILKGQVVEEDGGMVCVFNTYNFDTPDTQRVPLDMITHEFAKHQNIKPKN